MRRPWRDDPQWTPRGATLPQSLKLMPDDGADLSVWGLDWQAPGLPRPMLDRLTDWQDTFDEHFDPITGWDAASVRDEWAAGANALVSDLRAILDPNGSLEVDLWPLGRDGSDDE